MVGKRSGSDRLFAGNQEFGKGDGEISDVEAILVGKTSSYGLGEGGILGVGIRKTQNLCKIRESYNKVSW